MAYALNSFTVRSYAYEQPCITSMENLSLGCCSSLISLFHSTLHTKIDIIVQLLIIPSNRLEIKHVCSACVADPTLTSTSVMLFFAVLLSRPAELCGLPKCVVGYPSLPCFG